MIDKKAQNNGKVFETNSGHTRESDNLFPTKKLSDNDIYERVANSETEDD